MGVGKQRRHGTSRDSGHVWQAVNQAPSSIALIQYASRIQFGFGAREKLRSELDLLGVKRALLMTDRGVVESGVTGRALEHLAADAIAATYDCVTTNPTEANVIGALSHYREHACDCIIAVGGGSPIDAAKMTAVLATHGGELAGFRTAVGGGVRITAAVAPVIAIPTTAGTGSEIARGAGIALASGEKVAFNSQHLIPRVAICDPELTLSLPRFLTAGTGIDALSHCLEGYLSSAVNPPADAVALDGIERLMTHLPRAVSDGSARDARWNMMMGAIEGGMSILRGLGPAHALSIPLDAYDLHHGTLVGVLLPYTVDFVAASVGAERMERLARAMGCERAAAIPEKLHMLNAAIGLPADLSALGVAKDVLPAVAMAAAQSHFNQTSARIGTPDDYLSLVRSAMYASAS